MVKLSIVPGPHLAKMKRDILATAKKSFISTAVYTMNVRVRPEAVRNAPVYEPTGAKALPKPKREHELIERGVHRGKEWIETVVKTLAEQYGISVDEPRPGALRAALEPQQRLIDEGAGIVGIFSRQALDEATHYNARIILRSMEVPTRTKHNHGNQLLWYDWDNRTWQTASFIGTSANGAYALGSYSLPDSSWRRDIPPRSGYWADVEFGTEDRQVAEALGDDNLFMVYASNQGMSLELIKGGRGSTGIPPHYFLMKAARKAYDVFKGDLMNPTQTLYRANFGTAARAIEGT